MFLRSLLTRSPLCSLLLVAAILGGSSFAQAHYGAPVEIDKPQDARGKYQRPELYCLPPDAGEFYAESAHLDVDVKP